MESQTMSTAPAVTVVIPAYNAALHIAGTLDSVLAQTWRDFEVIVVDDGSTDDTSAVVAGFGNAVTCIRRANGGPAAARNTGIRAARGRYIALLDADDRWEPNLLAVQVPFLEQHPDAGLVFADMSIQNREGETVASYIARCGQPMPLGVVRQTARDVYLLNIVTTSTVVMRKAVALEAGLFDETIPYGAEDWDLWLRIAAKAPVVGHGAVLGHRTEHAENLSIQTQYLASHIAVLERLKHSFVALAGEKAPNLDRRLSFLFLARGYRYFDQGLYPEARRDLFRSLKGRFCSRAAFLLLATFAGVPAVTVLRRIKQALQSCPQ